MVYLRGLRVSSKDVVELASTNPPLKALFLQQRNKLIEMLVGGLVKLPEGFSGDPLVCPGSFGGIC